jgi:Family of unknown function (DUF5996)
MSAVRALGGQVEIDPTPQETPWKTPLDQDEEHATYDPDWVGTYFAAATRAAGVLAALRAPYRGRSTPVNAWWGSFDLAVSLFSGVPADPPARDFITRNAMNAEEVAVGWWPGDPRYPRAAFYAYAHPARPGVRGRNALAACRPLGRHARRVRPRLGRRVCRRRPARTRPRLRALGRATRMRGLRVGQRSRGKCGGPPIV